MRDDDDKRSDAAKRLMRCVAMADDTPIMSDEARKLMRFATVASLKNELSALYGGLSKADQDRLIEMFGR